MIIVRTLFTGRNKVANLIVDHSSHLFDLLEIYERDHGVSQYHVIHEGELIESINSHFGWHTVSFNKFAREFKYD